MIYNWDTQKENLREDEYNNMEQLLNKITMRWNMNIYLLEQIIDKMVSQLQLLINQTGNLI